MPKQLSLKPQVRKLLKRGIEHHQAGRRQSAEACYERVLKIESRCPQALHLLGLLAQQAGEPAKSVELLRAALALNPDDLDTLNGLAESALSQGDVTLARNCCCRVTELHSDSATAHLRLGNVLERDGECEQALQSYERALQLRPDSPDLHLSLARLQYKQGAIKEAAETCRRALSLDPSRHDILTQLGNALTDLADFGGAVAALRQALALHPDSPEAMFALGYFFERKGDLTGAAASYCNALKLNPRFEPAYLHLGIAHQVQGALAEAAACFERALEIAPHSAEARAFLGLIHLAQGNFKRGLQEYEDRWSTAYGHRFRRKFSQKPWKGEPLQGSRILLWAEQGMGDTLQFVRYVPLVAARGGTVVLEVQPRLQRLLRQTPGAAEVMGRGEPMPDCEWQCPLASLPLVLGTEVDSIPAEIPYIYADARLAETWRQKLAAGSLRIGVAWAGSPLHPHEVWRAIPLEQLAPLTHLEGTAFYSLQMGPASEQARQLGSRLRMVDLQHEQSDLADAAAIVANLDLVISIDTSIAHLAGAMGKPVWILLSTASDWRWLLERDDSPWYPTARLFRQAALGDWRGVLSRVEQELRALLAKAAAHSGGDHHE